MSNINISYLLFTLVFITSCKGDKINSEKEYFKWVNDKNNGLVIEKKVNKILLKVKYFPPELLTYKELRDEFYTQKTIDSLQSIYLKSRTFLLTLSPTGESQEEMNKDIMYNDIFSEDEYEKRYNELHFNISNYIQLNTTKNKYTPVLSTFENTYGVGPYKSIYLVFVPKNIDTDDIFTSSNIEFIFNDLIFETGISHFLFKKRDLDNIPHINFWKK